MSVGVMTFAQSIAWQDVPCEFCDWPQSFVVSWPLTEQDPNEELPTLIGYKEYHCCLYCFSLLVGPKETEIKNG